MREGTDHRKMEEKFDKLTEELGLTPEQETELKQQRSQFKAQKKELWGKIRAKKKELKEELEKPDVDRAKVDKIIGEIKDLTGQKLEARVNKIISMKSILTPEQFKKLKEKMEKECAPTRKDKDKHHFKQW